MNIPDISQKQRFGIEIKSLANMLQRNMDRHVRQSGFDELTVMHGWVIAYLYRNEGKEIFQKDLEKEFGIRSSSVTNVLQLMEKKGYIRRESVDYDSRLKRLVLLDTGRSFFHSLETMMKNMTYDTLEGIEDEKLDVFFEVIEKMKKNLKKQQEDNND